MLKPKSLACPVYAIQKCRHHLARLRVPNCFAQNAPFMSSQPISILHAPRENHRLRLYRHFPEVRCPTNFENPHEQQS